jgi:hypothetical protein
VRDDGAGTSITTTGRGKAQEGSMGCLDGQGYTVTEITFTITSHDRAGGGRFTVPAKIARELGSGDDKDIGLRVIVDGVTEFDDVHTLASGTEAYPIVGVGRRQALVVTARRL